MPRERSAEHGHDDQVDTLGEHAIVEPASAHASSEQLASGVSQSAPPVESSAAEIAHVGQETAEIDMAAVLGEEADRHGDVAPAGIEEAAPDHADAQTSDPGAPSSVAELTDEDLEREAPEAGASAGVEEHEHTQPQESRADGDHGESVEDVLEETPDFLQDTPEQERLWFEQQPPRDFDFDK
ncbi:MAG TPA: hypothetical protein VLJ42_00560 [Solirubrobacteraceae bacterium]|nr:hypothetical protein [Solirubrobacteraceae bacterium]